MISLLMISRSVMKAHFLDVWNLIEIVALSLALATNLAFQYSGKAYLNETALAIAMGLLWLKLLGFLKALNREMATFILAIVQILHDIRWFLVILAIGIFTFSDMVHIIATGGGWDSCETAEGYDTAADFCSENVFTAYLRSYSILVGDVNLDDYRETPFTSFLFVAFTFLGIIILLTMLVAVVSDSYEKSRMNSERLFGRARVQFISERITIEQFVRSKHSASDNTSLCSRGIWYFVRLLRWVSLLSVLGTAGIADCRVAVATSRLFSDVEKYGSGVGLFAVSIVCTIMLNAGILPLCGCLLQGCLPSHLMSSRIVQNNVVQTMMFIVSAPVRIIHNRLSARTEKSMKWTKDSVNGESEWSGHLDYINQHTRSIVKDSEARVSAAVKASEDRICQYDDSLTGRLQADLLNLTHAMHAKREDTNNATLMFGSGMDIMEPGNSQ